MDEEVYRLADNWFELISLHLYQSRPINYLEIGVKYGHNAISVYNTYALHTDSKIYCIDPWEDYTDYDEYQGEQENTYSKFLENIHNDPKFKICRGFSHIEIPKLPEDYFDIIYIDGNHNSEYVLEDAVLSFRKLKLNGKIIFDDYGWRSDKYVKRGVDSFYSSYQDRLKYLGNRNSQMFFERIK